jgi:single-stranded-DNA-specific exonuclease
MGKPSWLYLDADEQLTAKFKSTFNISESVSRVMVNRGIKDVEEAEIFLYPTLGKIPHPSLMKDLCSGVARIILALKNKEKIVVYGDYDADGITACAVITIFLKNIGADVSYYLPDRIKEGYSLNKEAVSELSECGVNLIITVDCGISDYEIVEFGKNLGLDFIITDHHLPPSKIPEAVAVINPKRTDCKFPFNDLAGVGVAFYLLIELRTQLRETGFFSDSEEPNLREYLDLVAIGTVADMMPLMGPNRVFVKYGLDEIRKTKRVGIKSLSKDIVSGSIDARSISHRIAPRINAPGRMSSPLHSLELLMTMDEEKAAELTKMLNGENYKRQQEEERIIQSAIKMLESMEDRLCYVLYSPEWHQGVVGIVASKLLDRYNRPFFILTDEKNGLIRGSARSVDGFPLNTILDGLSHLLEEYGGHAMAAGLSLKKERLKDFSDSIELMAKDYISEKKLSKFFEIDCVLDVKEINDKFFDDLSLLEPFGCGNPQPVFIIKDVVVENARAVGNKEKHLKLYLKKDNICFPCIGFFMYDSGITERASLDILGVPKISEYNGTRKWDFHLKDFYVNE